MALVEARQAARARRDWAEADALRERIAQIDTLAPRLRAAQVQVQVSNWLIASDILRSKQGYFFLGVGGA
jgi:hypothetical protein